MDSVPSTEPRGFFVSNSPSLFSNAGQDIAKPIRDDNAVNCHLFFAQNDFAMADRLIVHPKTIFVRAGVYAGTRGAALELAPLRRLKDVGLKRAAIGIEFDLEIRCVGKPHDLFGRADHYNFGDYTYQDQFLGHRFAPLRRPAKIT
jgi:hypothetical protein